MHVFSATWKGTATRSTRAVKWYVDAPYTPGAGPSGGTLVTSVTNQTLIPTRAYPFFLMLYLQILSGSASSPQRA